MAARSVHSRTAGLANDVIRSECFLFTIRFGCVIIKEELEFSAAEIRVADLLAADFPAAGHLVMEILYARTLAFLFHSELF